MELKKHLFVLVMIILFAFAAGCSVRDTITGDAVADDELEMETDAGEEAGDESRSEVNIVPMEASKIRSLYESIDFTDCGELVRRNNEEGNSGNYIDIYGCFNKAFKNCERAKALLDIQTTEGARVISFLSTANCKVTNTIKGNDPYGLSGEYQKTCNEINSDLALHYACIDYTEI